MKRRRRRERMTGRYFQMRWRPRERTALPARGYNCVNFEGGATTGSVSSQTYGGLGAFGGGGGGRPSARSRGAHLPLDIHQRRHRPPPQLPCPSSSKQRSRDRSWVTSDRYLPSSLTLPVLLSTSVSLPREMRITEASSTPWMEVRFPFHVKYMYRYMSPWTS